MSSFLGDLRKLRNGSLDTLEEELAAHDLPELTFEPSPHPLDDPAFLAPPKLFKARRVALSGMGMLQVLINPACITSYEVSGFRKRGSWN